VWSSHSKRRAVELRGNDRSASHATVRHARYRMPQQLRNGADQRSRAVGARKAYRLVTGRRSGNRITPYGPSENVLVTHKSCTLSSKTPSAAGDCTSLTRQLTGAGCDTRPAHRSGSAADLIGQETPPIPRCALRVHESFCGYLGGHCTPLAYCVGFRRQRAKIRLYPKR
jgi:hypothetical protein